MRRISVVLALTFVLGCGDDDPTVPMPLDDLEWVLIPFLGEQVLPVGILAPEGPPKGAIIAFPWGAGHSDFVRSLMDSYWDEAAIDAGYVVLGVEVFGPGVEELGDDILPPILEYLDINFPSASDDIVMTGASAGGRGAFFAALAAPSRVTGILAMPGSYDGDAQALTALAGVPTLLLVGENDTQWVALSEATLAALEGAGVPATLDILPGQDHVLTVPQADLVEWIEGR